MQGMVSNPRAFPNAQMLLGDFYVRARKPEIAMAAYQQGAKDDSKDAVKYQERLVALQAETNHPEQALSMAKDLSDKNPKDVNASQLYAELLLRTSSRGSIAKTVEEVRNWPTIIPKIPFCGLNWTRLFCRERSG